MDNFCELLSERALTEGLEHQALDESDVGSVCEI